MKKEKQVWKMLCDYLWELEYEDKLLDRKYHLGICEKQEFIGMLARYIEIYPVIASLNHTQQIRAVFWTVQSICVNFGYTIKDELPASI